MMIFNMRNRGAYEYDKFALNVLQMHNAVTLSEMHELKENLSEKRTLLKMQKEINQVHAELTGYGYNKVSLSENIFINSFKARGK